MSYFLVVFLMLLFSLELSYLLKRAFGYMLAFSNLSLIFVLYIGGLFCDIYITALVFFAVIVLLGIFTAAIMVKRKDYSNLTVIFHNPSFYLYILLAIAFGVAFWCYTPKNTDEMTHWALVVKNMFAYHNFGNLGNSTTMFNRYVPATGLFMFAFQVFNSEFHAGMLFASFDLLIISLLFPIFDLFKGKFTLSALMSGMMALLFPMLFKSAMYYDILVDGILGVMTGFIYLIYRIDRGKADILTILTISLGCFVLTTTKTSGIALAVFALIFIAIDAFTLGRENVKKFFKKKINFAIMLLPILFLLFGKLSWSWYVNYYNVRAGWDASEMTFANIINWIKNPTPYQTQVTKIFFKTFFVSKLSLSGFLRLPYLLVIILMIGAGVLLGFATKNKKFAISHSVAGIVLSVGYGISLLLLYIFSFAYWEGLSLASYKRYNSTNMMAMFFIYYYLFADLFAEKILSKTIEKRKFYPKLKRILVPLTLVVYGLSSLGVAIGGYFRMRSEANEFLSVYKDWISCVETLNKEDSVYIVIKDDEEWTQAFSYIHMRYLATPMQTSGYLEGGSYTMGRDANVCYTGNPFSSEFSVEAFADAVRNYTHLYVKDVWVEFENKFGALFEGELKENTLYKVFIDEDGLKLIAE